MESKIKRFAFCVVAACVIMAVCDSLLQLNRPNMAAKTAEMTPNDYEALDAQIRLRALRHHEICNNLEKRHPKSQEIDQYVSERLIVDESKKLVFCPVPKAGSSNWKRIFVKLTNDDYGDVEDLLDIRGVHHIHLPTLSEYSKDKQIEIINSYNKFIFVRHPFDRILSAYRNKLESPFTDEFRRRYGRKIVANYRPYATEEAKDTGADVSFTEFLRYIIDERPAKFNNHWMRYWDLCQPCQVRYDFIGTAENYANEADLFVKKMNISVVFPEHEPKTSHESSLAVFGGLSRAYLTKLYNVYKPDFVVFNYTIDRFLAATDS